MGPWKFIACYCPFCQFKVAFSNTYKDKVFEIERGKQKWEDGNEGTKRGVGQQMSKRDKQMVTEKETESEQMPEATTDLS